MQKKWNIFLSHEPNRLSESNLVEAYEKLFPRNKYKMNPSKEGKKFKHKNCFKESLKQSKGNSK